MRRWEGTVAEAWYHGECGAHEDEQRIARLTRERDEARAARDEAVRLMSETSQRAGRAEGENEGLRALLRECRDAIEAQRDQDDDDLFDRINKAIGESDGA